MTGASETSGPKPTAAQLRTRSIAQADISEVLLDLDSPDTVSAVCGALMGRHDLAPADLAWLGNVLCRLAWAMERE